MDVDDIPEELKTLNLFRPVILVENLKQIAIDLISFGTVSEKCPKQHIKSLERSKHGKAAILAAILNLLLKSVKWPYLILYGSDSPEICTRWKVV